MSPARLAVPLLALALAVPGVVTTPAVAADPLEAFNVNLYAATGVSGATLTGDVRNTTGKVLQEATVTVELHDSSGETIGTTTAAVATPRLGPGETGSFSHWFDPPAGARTYEVSGTSAEVATTLANRNFTITVTKREPPPDYSNTEVITGTVRNDNAVPADEITVLARFSDDEGNVDVASVVASAADGYTKAAPGESLSFRLEHPVKDGMPALPDVGLFADSASLPTPIHVEPLPLRAKSRIVYGERLTVPATILMKGTAGRIDEVAMELHSSRTRDGQYVMEDYTFSGASPMTVTPAASGFYKVVAPDDEDRHVVGASGTPVGVTVVARVGLTAPATARPGTVALRGTVGPRSAGQRVVLQRYLDGQWRTVAATTLDAASAYSFAVRLPKGTFHHRTVFARNAAVEGASSPQRRTVVG